MAPALHTVNRYLCCTACSVTLAIRRRGSDCRPHGRSQMDAAPSFPFALPTSICPKVPLLSYHGTHCRAASAHRHWNPTRILHLESNPPQCFSWRLSSFPPSLTVLSCRPRLHEVGTSRSLGACLAPCARQSASLPMLMLMLMLMMMMMMLMSWVTFTQST